MVGEMRDQETSTIAIRAALTGHLVLSTIHTNSTVATITRLRNLTIPSYLISSTMLGIIAQRLVRVICPFCKIVDHPSDEDLRKIGLAGRDTKGVTFYRGKGCSECAGTGFKGRLGMYEVLALSARIKEYISNEASESSIKQLAVAEGMTTLAYAGVEKVLKGVTSVAGLLGVYQTEEVYGSSCPGCGFVLSTEFLACPQCGKRVIEMCPTCAKILDPLWSYCPYCAEKVSRSISFKRSVRQQ
jgi:type II secretory ATPase GspE/PulE/Tfp pilus assembly ATPase PilB-like protein